MDEKEDITIETLERFLSEMADTVSPVHIEDPRKQKLAQDINTAKMRVAALRKEIADLNVKIKSWQIQLDNLKMGRAV